MNIILLTQNEHKKKEISSLIKGYGFELLTMSDVEKTAVEIYNELGIDNFIIIREQTKLISKSNLKEKLVHLDQVLHTSKIWATFYNQGVLEERTYSADVDGFIDITRKVDGDDSIYNWDDVFVCLKTFKTYHEMKDDSGKFSARSIAVSIFLKDITDFENKIDLNFNPLNQRNVVSFSGEIYDLLESNKYLKLHLNSPILSNLMSHIKKDGLFTRSSINRKQRNYWYPSLNSGLPLTPKKDEIHEITFMFHDLMHHAIPDLIMTGEDNELYKDAYIIHRMLSEAFTIVLADMVFIDTLVKSGINYDWSKRKIYPIYKAMNIDVLTIEKLKDIIWANVNFALLGDDSLLVNLANREVVNDYKDKYEKFFIEDYRWTLNNFENMVSNKAEIKKWYQETRSLIPKGNCIDEYSNVTDGGMAFDSKVKVIFDKCWESISQKMRVDVYSEKSESTNNAFINYMIGQSIIFFKYDFVQESKVVFELIFKELSNPEIIGPERIQLIRNLFNMYLERLVSCNLLSKADSDIYKEIVPLFEAFYVFYEKELKYKSIKDLLRELF